MRFGRGALHADSSKLTVLFLFFAFAATQVGNAAAQGGQTQNNNTLSQVPNSGTLIYISLAFGFSLAVNAWVFFRISGGMSCPRLMVEWKC